MKTYMTPEEHARLHRRRARQALGLLVAVLVLVGAVTVVRAGVRTVANLFDDTQHIPTVVRLATDYITCFAGNELRTSF